MHALRITSGVAIGAAIIVSALVAPAAAPAITPNATSLHFTASGDFGAVASTQAVLAGISAAHPDLHLALGDLSYTPTGQEQAWCDLVTQNVGAGFPFELVSGNHESNGQNGNINDFSACLPNQLPGAVGTYGRQYYVDVPQGAPLVRFVMISPALPFSDGTWSYAAGTPHYNWTAAAIDGAHAAGIPWVVVGMHKPCLSMGQYSCDPGADLLNLLVNKHVDLVLTGHDHVYQRTQQLATGSGCAAIVPGTFTAACLADNDNSMAKGAGTVFVTAGTGGNGNYDINPADTEANYFATSWGSSANPVYGSLDVTATPTQLTANFARVAGASFADSFTVGPDVWNGNKPPNASFTSTCANLACTFDGSASSDVDGTIASYAWDFGDGGSATGVTPPHTYTAAGIYTARLTVTDNGGSTATTTRTVNVVGNQPPNASFTSACAGLACTFDGSASNDSDGTIASYAWDFGDGGSATGATPPHTYATAGSYTARLTVTDNGGSTGTTTRTVNPAGNQPPNASFTSACTMLACTFNGNASNDPDGTIASYAWDFGDGGSATGATPPHTYATAGSYTSRLTVTDDGGSTGTTTRTVTVAGNQPPNASFTSACTDLACTFNGSASNDPDGTIASYAWDFGDGASATGATPPHSYASAGSYTARLTVTDNGGSTGTTTRTVSVTAPPPPGALASDAFERAVSGGWGTAPTGGPWTFAGSATRYLVSGGAGAIQLPTGSGGSTYLTSVSSAATDLRLKVGLDKLPSSGSVYLSISGRRIATTGSYQSKVIISSAGKLSIWVVRVNPTGGAEVVLQTGVAVPGTFTVASKVAIRVKVTGTNPTLIETRAWLDGTPEPTTWQRSITDSTPELQAAGGIGITGYLSSGVANTPVSMTVDDLSAVVP